MSRAHDEGADEALTDEQLATLEAMLRAAREEVQRSLAASVGDARPVDLDLSIGRLTRVDALQQQHMATDREQRLRVRLAQIQQALARIHTGTYGECVRCEESIRYERLAARPETPFCLRCQS